LAREGGLRLVGADLRAEAPAGVPLDDYVVADFGRAETAEAAIGRVRPELVFHLVGVAAGEAGELYRVNLLSGIHLLESLRRTSPGARVLIVGSAAEYGAAPPAEMPLTEEHPCRPSGAYGLSKHALTLAALDYARQGMKVVVVRPFNIVGAGVPPSLVVGALVARAKKALAGNGDATIAIGNLEPERDFVAVEDVVRAYARLMRGEHWGEVFNICSGRPLPVRAVAERLLAFAPRPVRLEVDPALVRPADAPSVYGSWQKAHRHFGFEPATPLEEALRAAWQQGMGSAA
jgi:GDP-4-dehydro-6-deoxy-D-mannose reductase